MKTLTIVALTVAAVFIAGSWRLLSAEAKGAGLASAAEPATPGSSGRDAATSSAADAPVAVVDRFSRALAAGDTLAASALLDPAVVIYESGEVERSRDEYAAHHLGADADFLQAAELRLLSRASGSAGGLAWVASESRLTTHGAKPVDLISTETMMLRKQPDGWRIVHIHWSSRKASH